MKASQVLETHPERKSQENGVSTFDDQAKYNQTEQIILGPNKAVQLKIMKFQLDRKKKRLDRYEDGAYRSSQLVIKHAQRPTTTQIENSQVGRRKKSNETALRYQNLISKKGYPESLPNVKQAKQSAFSNYEVGSHSIEPMIRKTSLESSENQKELVYMKLKDQQLWKEKTPANLSVESAFGTPEQEMIGTQPKRNKTAGNVRRKKKLAKQPKVVVESHSDETIEARTFIRPNVHSSLLQTRPFSKNSSSLMPPYSNTMNVFSQSPKRKQNDLKLSMQEKKFWRKTPTMLVTDMVQNREKSQVENIYIASTKFMQLQDNVSFEEIRSNLNKTYGGFNQDGEYFSKAEQVRINYDCQISSKGASRQSQFSHRAKETSAQQGSKSGAQSVYKDAVGVNYSKGYNFSKESAKTPQGDTKMPADPRTIGECRSTQQLHGDPRVVHQQMVLKLKDNDFKMGVSRTVSQSMTTQKHQSKNKFLNQPNQENTILTLQNHHHTSEDRLNSINSWSNNIAIGSSERLTFQPEKAYLHCAPKEAGPSGQFQLNTPQTGFEMSKPEELMKQKDFRTQRGVSIKSVLAKNKGIVRKGSRTKRMDPSKLKTNIHIIDNQYEAQDSPRINLVSQPKANDEIQVPGVNTDFKTTNRQSFEVQKENEQVQLEKEPMMVIRSRTFMPAKSSSDFQVGEMQALYLEQRQKEVNAPQKIKPEKEKEQILSFLKKKHTYAPYLKQAMILKLNSHGKQQVLIHTNQKKHRHTKSMLEQRKSSMLKDSHQMSNQAVQAGHDFLNQGDDGSKVNKHNQSVVRSLESDDKALSNIINLNLQINRYETKDYESTLLESKKKKMPDGTSKNSSGQNSNSSLRRRQSCHKNVDSLDNVLRSNESFQQSIDQKGIKHVMTTSSPDAETPFYTEKKARSMFKRLKGSIDCKKKVRIKGGKIVDREVRNVDRIVQNAINRRICAQRIENHRESDFESMSKVVSKEKLRAITNLKHSEFMNKNSSTPSFKVWVQQPIKTITPSIMAASIPPNQMRKTASSNYFKKEVLGDTASNYLKKTVASRSRELFGGEQPINKSSYDDRHQPVNYKKIVQQIIMGSEKKKQVNMVTEFPSAIYANLRNIVHNDNYRTVRNPVQVTEPNFLHQLSLADQNNISSQTRILSSSNKQEHFEFDNHFIYNEMLSVQNKSDTRNQQPLLKQAQQFTCTDEPTFQIHQIQLDVKGVDGGGLTTFASKDLPDGMEDLLAPTTVKRNQNKDLQLAQELTLNNQSVYSPPEDQVDMTLLSKFINDQRAAADGQREEARQPADQNLFMPQQPNVFLDIIYPEYIKSLTDVNAIRHLRQNLVQIRETILQDANDQQANLLNPKASNKKNVSGIEFQEESIASNRSSVNIYSDHKDNKRNESVVANKNPTNNLPSTNNLSNKSLSQFENHHTRKSSQGKRIDRNSLNKDLQSLEQDSHNDNYLIVKPQPNPKIRVISRGSLNIKAVISKEQSVLKRSSIDSPLLKDEDDYDSKEPLSAIEIRLKRQEMKQQKKRNSSEAKTSNLKTNDQKHHLPKTKSDNSLLAQIEMMGSQEMAQQVLMQNQVFQLRYLHLAYLNKNIELLEQREQEIEHQEKFLREQMHIKENLKKLNQQLMNIGARRREELKPSEFKFEDLQISSREQTTDGVCDSGIKQRALFSRQTKALRTSLNAKKQGDISKRDTGSVNRSQLSLNPIV